MSFKELCANSQDRRYSDITGIVDIDVMVEGRPIQKIKDNWIILLSVLAIFMGLLLSKFSVNYFATCMGLLVLFALLFILGNTYKVTCKKDNLHIKQNFQNISIPYKSIKNVFISKTSKMPFSNTYVLVIRCEDNLSFLREFEFPLFCSNADEITKFINNFKIANGTSQKYVTFEKRKSLRRLLENLFTAFFIAIIMWFLFTRGIIKFF